MKKNAFFLCFAVAALSSSVCCQAQTKEEKITSIKRQFAAINADKSYNKILLTNEVFLNEQATDGGKEVTGYFKGDTLVKIGEYIGISNGNYLTEYYLDNDSLRFVYTRFQMFAYTDSAGFDYTKMGDVVFEGRYYYDGNKVIDKLIKGYKEYDERSSLYVTDVKKYVAMLYKRKRGG